MYLIWKNRPSDLEAMGSPELIEVVTDALRFLPSSQRSSRGEVLHRYVEFSQARSTCAGGVSDAA